VTAPPVPGFSLKVSRADAHLCALDLELASWRKNEPCRIIFEAQPDPSYYLLCAVDLKPVPDAVTLIIGDALQCLRTSLDHLVWQLTRDWSGIPEKSGHIEFPVFWDDADAFAEKGRGSRKIAGIHPDAKKIIVDLQPLQPGDSYTSSPLYRLHELNRRDKHRKLIVAVVTGEINQISVPGALNMHMGGLLATQSGTGQRLEENSVLGHVLKIPGLPDPAVDSEIRLMLDIAIDEEGFPLMEWSGFFRETVDWLEANVFGPLIPLLGIQGPDKVV
jgi:hypothetical protein